jgi:hypothetical protein
MKKGKRGKGKEGKPSDGLERVLNLDEGNYEPSDGYGGGIETV